MDAMDKAIINRLHGGFPVADRPFAIIADELGMDEAELIGRISAMRESGVLSRFGPMYDAKAMGGALTLCALSVPPERFEEVASMINAHPEVAHNYEREHELNMWFVLATGTPEEIDLVLARIAEETGLAIVNLPKLDEYFLELRLVA